MLPVNLLLWAAATVLLGLLRGASGISYTIAEERPSGTVVGNVGADPDLLRHYQADVVPTLEFSFLLPQTVLTIEKRGGLIRTSGRLDRDTVCPSPTARCVISADVAVTPVQVLRIINVIVLITDINDNAPRFPEPEVSVRISEVASPGARIKLPLAVDPDWGNHGVQEYRYSPGGIPGDEMFRLEVTAAADPTTSSGLVQSVSLVLMGKLDREEVDSYRGTLVAYDGGSTRLSGSVIVNVAIDDANDHTPTFDNNTYTTTIPENSPVNSSVLRVRARDADIGDFGRVRYTISNSPVGHQAADTFGIDSKTGLIYLKKSPDYETKSSYTFTVEAIDGGPNSEAAQTTVVVTIRDLNDNPPVITVNALTSSGVAQISESSPGKLNAIQFVAHVSVTDADAGENGFFGCNLDSGLFMLDRFEQRGQYKIVTNAQFDREAQAEHFIRLTCRDQGTPAQVAVATVTVTVEDKNDNPPTFVQSVYSVTLVENNQVDAFIVAVNASDPDVGLNSALTYHLQETSSPMPLLRINPTTGAIYANVVFDFETQKEFHFKVVAQDGGTPPQSATATVYVTIVDINDNAPFFSKPSYEFEVMENQPIGMEIGLVAASDADSEPYNQFEFSFQPGKAARLFAVDTRTGHIRTKASLDREYEAEYTLTVVATNIHVDRTLSSSVQVHITVQDKNDNAPHVDFPNQQNHTLHISNLVPVGYEVGIIRAHDVDDEDNARLAYSFTHNSDNSAFHIDKLTGLISTHASLENYDTKLFEMAVLVSDYGEPPKTATATLYVVVDKSIVFASGARGSSLLGSTNLTIVIGLAVSSAVVVVILVVAIILTRMNSRKNNSRSRAYTKNKLPGLNILRTAVKNQTGTSDVQSNTNKQQSKNDYGQNQQSKNDYSQNSKNHAKETSVTQPCNLNKKEVSFSMQNETIHQQQYTATNNKAINPGKVDNLTRPSWTPTAVATDSSKCVQWFETMKPAEQDTDNSSAGEVSTTDSGRGPSEEGENSLGSVPPILGPQRCSGASRQPAVNHTHRPGAGPSGKGTNRAPTPDATRGARPSSSKAPPTSSSNLPRTTSRPQVPAKRPHRYHGQPQHTQPQRPAPPCIPDSAHHIRGSANSANHPHSQRQKPQQRQGGGLTYSTQRDYMPTLEEGVGPWYGGSQQGVDVYGDTASTTSGSYIVDHKDLDDMLPDSPPYTSVVV